MRGRFPFSAIRPEVSFTQTPVPSESRKQLSREVGGHVVLTMKAGHLHSAQTISAISLFRGEDPRKTGRASALMPQVFDKINTPDIRTL